MSGWRRVDVGRRVRSDTTIANRGLEAWVSMASIGCGMEVYCRTKGETVVWKVAARYSNEKGQK